MLKIKMIDLLNKIANGEEVPKIIKYKNVIWYFNKKYKTYFMNNTEIELFYIEKITERLNDEIEIIEEPQEHKIPEKLKASDYEEVQSQFDLDVISRINEILDYLEKVI